MSTSDNRAARSQPVAGELDEVPVIDVAPGADRLVEGVGGAGVGEPQHLPAVVGRVGQHAVLAGAEDGHLLLGYDLLQRGEYVLAVDLAEAVAELVEDEHAAFTALGGEK